MPSFAATICVACGNDLSRVARSRCRRCEDCISADRVYSLVLARHARDLWWPPEFDDYDPVARAAA
jgi:predicted amidophosphoribosyltransferase